MSNHSSCPDCGHKVSLSVRNCPNCGRPTTTSTATDPNVTPRSYPTIYGGYPSTKEEEEEMYQFCKSCFKWMGGFFAVYITLAVIYALIVPNQPQNVNVISAPQGATSSEKRDIIDTCEEAKENLRYALDKRDAITPSEAMTSEGMTEWKKWRDRGVELESLALELCPSGEPLLSQPSADN